MMLTKKLRMTAILLIFLLLVGCAPAAVSSQTVSKPEYNLQLTTEDLMIYTRYSIMANEAYINADGKLRFTDYGRKNVSNPEKYEQLENVISISAHLNAHHREPDFFMALQSDGTATVVYYDLYSCETNEPIEAGQYAKYYAELQKFCDGKTFKHVHYPYFLTTDGDYYYFNLAEKHANTCTPQLLASDVVYADQNAVLLKDGRVAILYEGELKYIEEWTDIVQIAQPVYNRNMLLGLRANGSIVALVDENFDGQLINADAVVKALIPNTDYARTSDDRIIRLALLYGETEPKAYPTCSPEALAVYEFYAHELLPNGTLQPIHWHDLDSDREISEWNSLFGGPLTTRVWENE